MGCKPSFIYNTGIRRRSKVLILTYFKEVGLNLIAFLSQNGKTYFSLERVFID
jgi:hypothetical protein